MKFLRPTHKSSKLDEFFEYLEQKKILALKNISQSTVDDFIATGEKLFYKKRARYNSHYTQAILVAPIENFLLFLAEMGAITYVVTAAKVQDAETLLGNVLLKYLDYCEHARGLTPGAVNRVNLAVKRFSSILDSNGISKIAAINIGHVDLFQAKYKTSRSAILTNSSILRRFLKWLYLEGELPSDVSRLVISPRSYALSKVPAFLSDDEIQRIFDFGKIGDRSENSLVQSVLHVLLFSGLRIGEVCRLELDDINWDDRIIVIKNRKNESDLLIPLSQPLFDCLHIIFDGPMRASHLRGMPAQNR